MQLDNVWPDVRLSDVLIEIVDCEHKTPEFVQSDYFFVCRTPNVRDGKIVFDDAKYTHARDFAEWTKRRRPVAGDILFTREAPAGELALVPEGVNLCMGQRMVLLVPNIEKIYPQYLIYQFYSSRMRTYFSQSTMGTTVSRINIADIYEIKFPLPPIQEQKKIATTLQENDFYIESLEKLIAKKRLIKRGVMKQLLENSIQDFEAVPLNSLCWFQEGPGVRTHQFTDSGVKLLNGTNIKKGQLDLDTTVRFISKSEAYGPYQHFLADEGDIVIASSGITVEKFHEKVAIVKSSDLPLCMNTSTIRFKPKLELLDRDFLFQYLMSDDFKSQIGGQATGSAQLNFGPFHLNRINIRKPSLEYQKNVAQILNHFDFDLATLEIKLQKARLLKQGMMQELLTGRIRLL